MGKGREGGTEDAPREKKKKKRVSFHPFFFQLADAFI